MLERLEKKKSKKLWILKKDYSKMKLVSCFRGLDCLSLRHLDNEKPTTIFWSKKKSKKLWSGLLFLGFYCSIQWRKILLEVTPEIFEHQKSLRSLQCSDRCWKKQPMLKKRTTDGHMGSRNFFDAEKKEPMLKKWTVARNFWIDGEKRTEQWITTFL